MNKLDKKYYFCSMIELAKHIEVLLLENDCVIVPGLGGFIAHNRQAEFKESNGLFCAPTRTIGFNPQLIMNDGLLVQTYMQAYSTDFPDATRKIENTVSMLKEQLYQTGEACLPNIGTLYYTMNGTYVFEPSSDTFFTPYLYGLGNFALTPLTAMKEADEAVTIHPFIPQPKQKEETVIPNISHQYGRTFRKLAQHTVGVAAAILLFFFLSVPVENTYMDDASYASLSAESMFDAIRSHSAATRLLHPQAEETTPQVKKVKAVRNNVNTLKPVAVRTEMVKKEPLQGAVQEEKSSKATASVSSKEVQLSASKSKTMTTASTKTASVEKKTTAVQKANTKGYYIIASSLATPEDAQKQLKIFQEKGFSNASVIASNQHYRVALFRFNNSGEAYKKLNELRKQEDFKTSWVFTSK